MSNRSALVAIFASCMLCMSGTGRVQADSVRQLRKGQTSLALNVGLLRRLGIRVETQAAVYHDGAMINLEILGNSDLRIAESGGMLENIQGDMISHDAIVTFYGPAGAVSLDGFVLALDGASEFASFVAVRDAKDRTPLIAVRAEKIGYDRISDSVLVEGSRLIMLEALANDLGVGNAAGVEIGEFQIAGDFEYLSGDDVYPSDGSDGAPRGGNMGTVCGVNVGPDVIVGKLTGTQDYVSEEIPVGSGNWIDAFSVGTTSCNIGTQGLKWISSTNEHPVIGQNFYRYYVDAGGVSHFEQLGQSWLKHGFTALQNNECGCGCQTGNGSLLGVGCSDPYGAGLNGGQSSAGPKWQVNAHTGVFTYPPANPTWSGNVARRMQIHVADLNESGARYFMEGQYVQPEDAQFGNNNNSASYIEVTMTGSGNNRNFDLSGLTQRELPGIRAWKSIDSSVEEVDVQVPNEGLFIISAKATAIAGGFYHYEYAVENLNSDRSARSFSVPLPSGVTVQNIGFRDVDYHSGDGEGSVNRDGADWATSWTPGGAVTWSTPDFTSAPNGNALRWGTLYNFRFDADAPPGTLDVEIGMFKPGTPTSVSASIVGPAGPPPVCGDSVVEGGEECDPPGNGCSAECEWICGDNIAHPPAEPCDEGGVDTANCDSDCSLVECGDGHTNTAAGETCDDAGDSANCDADCSAVACGDGYVNEAAGEECDPPGPDCDASCHRIPRCGDGIVDPGEVCDDGNNVSGDGCTATCESEFNDNCVEAIAVCPGDVSGTTLGATHDGSASCGSTSSSADVWYSYTPSSSGVLELNTCSSASYDTVLSLHTGCPGTNGNQAACNDDDFSCTGNRSRLTANVTGGNTYLIRVSGWNGAAGNFVLTVIGPECETVIVDCNNNGRDDADDIACGLDNSCNNIAGSGDCNANGIPDDCEITGGSESDCDGGPIGDWNAGAARVQNVCRFCHGPNADSTGCAGVCPGPNIRNKSREYIRLHLDPAIGTHGGGQHPEYTRQDYADLEAFLSDTGSHGRPDGVPDSCQTLSDCDSDLVSDGCELEAGSQLDPDGDGIPSDCEGCPNDPNKTSPGNCGCGNVDTAATGDMDGSGGVDGADIQLFVTGVMMSSVDPADLCPGDFDGSHVMDVGDMDGFVAALMTP